jgi:hypothetical protein
MKDARNKRQERRNIVDDGSSMKRSVEERNETRRQEKAKIAKTNIRKKRQLRTIRKRVEKKQTMNLLDLKMMIFFWTKLTN